jgi:hypothetical protein
MKLGYHHRRLLQHLLDHPDSAHGLHTQQVKRKAESLIKMGFIDESWRVTEAGKSRLANEEARQQQQQQTLSEGSLNQLSEAIGRDIPNTAAQAELLRAADNRVLFVGLETYLQRGGGIARDLFDAEHEGFLTDPNLLETLVTEKLDTEAEKLRPQTAGLPPGHINNCGQSQSPSLTSSNRKSIA